MPITFEHGIVSQIFRFRSMRNSDKHKGEHAGNDVQDSKKENNRWKNNSSTYPESMKFIRRFDTDTASTLFTKR